MKSLDLFLAASIVAAPGLAAADMTSDVAKPGVWCSEFDEASSSCATVVRFSGRDDTLQVSMVALHSRGTYALKYSMRARAVVRNNELCIRPKEAVASLRMYYTADALPSVVASDQQVEPAVMPDPPEESPQAKKALAGLPPEVCGLGPFKTQLTYVPESQATRLVLRRRD